MIIDFKKFIFEKAKQARILLNFLGLSGAQTCKSYNSRQELSNEYLLAKIGFDTAENGPLKMWR